MKIIDKFLKLSVEMKILIVAFPIIILGSFVAAFTYGDGNETESVFVEIPQNIVENTVVDMEVENEVMENIIENVIEEVPDKEEEEEEKKEEKVKFKNKEVVIPKSKVSSANSSEDAEKTKKTGGSAVSQEQAQTMFENVGQKSMGIDVSQHQGKIDWAAVRNSGVEFAIIRVGYRGQTQGGIYEDRYFKTNMSGAIANGIKVGVYFYSTAINEEEALEEAAWVVKKIAPYSVTYPVVYDFEDFNAHRCANVDGAQATKNALIYLNYVKSNGYEPMMYANKSDITKRMSRGSFSCKFWLAHYTEKTDYTGNVNMWQYTSQGNVPGISGGVDMNIAYFNYGTVAAPKHTHDFNEEVKNSYKAPGCEEKGSKVMACSCGEKETQELEAKGHDFGDWEITKIATSKEDGLSTRKCKNCEKTETKKIDKLKEDFENKVSNVVNNTVNNTVTNSVKNEVNNEVVNEVKNEVKNEVVEEKHTHDWVLESEVKPTCKNGGEKNWKCSDSTCNETRKDTFEKTNEHNFEGGKCTVCEALDPNFKEEPPVLENTVAVE